MRILCLDTSSKFLSLAVAEDHKILSQTHRLLDRKHSLQLVSMIDKILKKAKLSLKKIDGFCVGRGPGSFTGLRIGITAIKGFAFVIKKPVVAIPSLDILAQNAHLLRNQVQICAIVDARQNKVYACLYKMQNGELRRKSGYLLLPISKLLKRLKGKILFLGDAISVYREEICRSKNIKPIFAEERFWYPKAAQAVTLALQRLRKGKFEDVDSLAPLYLYPKECQIKQR